MYLKSNTRQENFRTFQENDGLDYQPLFGKNEPALIKDRTRETAEIEPRTTTYKWD